MTTLHNSLDCSQVRWPDGTGMVYLSMSPWHGMWKSRHQLMSRFAKTMPVVYVEPWVSLSKLRKHGSGLSRVISDVRKPLATRVSENLTVLGSSACRPVSGSELLARFTRQHWLSGIRRTVRSAGIEHPILWVCRPEMGFAVGQLGEQFSVYHIVDEYQGYTGVTSDDRDRLATHEADVLDRVDLAVVASPELANAKGGPGRDIVVLENGVNPEEYSAARRNPDYPADIGQVPSPRIGYSGLIGKRLNFKLITALAEQRKDYSIVLVGRVDTRECSEEIAHLKSLPNVYFLGEKNANDVAAYINCLDVGLLPYAVNLETENISPIKMYEYWAAGKPVVGTSIPATRRNSAAVAIANSTQEFIAEVEKAVGARDKSAQKLLIRLASKNSWQSRVDSISAEIQARLQSTAGRARAG